MQNMVGFRPVYVEIWPKYLYVHDFFVFLFCIFEVFPLLPLTIAPPRSLNRSKIIFWIIKYIQNIYCMVICPENISSGNLLFRNLSGPKMTNKHGKHSIFNSQYLACLPLFNPYIHTICSLCIIEPIKVHISTIYTISQDAFH